MNKVIIFIIIFSLSVIVSFAKNKSEEINKNKASTIIINNTKGFRILTKNIGTLYNKNEKSETLIKTVITFVKK